VVAIRPLGVEELAEVLAVDFEDAEGIPRLNPSWRWEDQEQALFTSCSSLIAIVDTGDSRVVQFSHFSVKEYLTSKRLSTSSQDVSRYHVVLEPAHTILGQACMSVLLQFQQDDVQKSAPLALYAAEHWVRHAQIEDVASHIKGTKDLFDPDKPYFAAWRQLHDIDTDRTDSVFFHFTHRMKSGENTPLYYAALCGFAGLVDQLIVKHPQHVNAIGGFYMTPAVAALAGRHFQLAQVVHRNGSSVDPRGHQRRTPLQSAVYYEDFEMVQALLDYGVDVNTQDNNGYSPLSYASNFAWQGGFNDPRVVRLLLDHGANPNVVGPGYSALTPLHQAVQYGRVEIVRLLVEHGASVEAKNVEGRTPLDFAAKEQRDEIIKLLLEHSAK
jgi:hypothetical protein